MFYLLVLSRCDCGTVLSVAVLEISGRPRARFPAIFWSGVITDPRSRLAATPTGSGAAAPGGPGAPGSVNCQDKQVDRYQVTQTRVFIVIKSGR